MALLPPSSSRLRPRRLAVASATALPMRVLPVADTSGTRASAAMVLPSVTSEVIRHETPSGTPFFWSTSPMMRWQARAVSGVFSDGFQMHTSPHTQAIMAFQDHTATGKLNADIMPTMPTGCHCSYIRCMGRSECIVRPYNWRDSPTAKSQISIISWTSPRPSCRLLPIS